tara:strand:- start:500 stop:703 length:204 start_codon:yes stop_codon:yes gene_type:complete
MGQMKRFAEEVSVQMGYGGEINDSVLKIAKLMLPQAHKLANEDGSFGLINNPSPSCHNMVKEEDKDE